MSRLLELLSETRGSRGNELADDVYELIDHIADWKVRQPYHHTIFFYMDNLSEEKSDKLRSALVKALFMAAPRKKLFLTRRASTSGTGMSTPDGDTVSVSQDKEGNNHSVWVQVKYRIN